MALVLVRESAIGNIRWGGRHLFEVIGKYQVMIGHRSFSGRDDIKRALHFQAANPDFLEPAA